MEKVSQACELARKPSVASAFAVMVYRLVPHRIVPRATQRIVVALCLVISFWAVGSKVATAEPLKIRVGYGATPPIMLGLAFENTSVMKHYGKTYTVERQFFPASTQEITAFAAKQLDVGFLAFPSFALAIENADAKLTVWGGGLQECVPGYFTQTWGVKKDSNIHSVADLRGKRIAVPAFGTGTDGGLRVFLKSHHIDPEKDVTIVEVNWPNQDAMLQQGKVDAAVYLANFWQPAMKRGDVRPLFTFCPATGLVQTLVQVARTEFLKEHRAEMQDFVEDFVRSVRWFRDPKNRPETLKLLSKFTKRPEDAFVGWAFTNKDEAFAPWAIPDMAAFQKNVDQFHEIGLLPKPLKVSIYTDLSLVKEAKERIGP